jgi:hypothetical protein
MIEPISAGIGAGVDLIGGLISGGMQMRQANKQRKQAEEILNETEFPTYSTPQAYQDSLSIMRALAQSRFAGQSQLEGRMGEQFAGTTNAIQQTAQDPASALAAITSAGQTTQDQLQNIGIQAAQFQQQNQGNLANYLATTMGAQQEKEYLINKQQPYERAMMAAGALTEASDINRMTAIQNMTGAASAGTSGFLEGYMKTKPQPTNGGGGGNPTTEDLFG